MAELETMEREVNGVTIRYNLVDGYWIPALNCPETEQEEFQLDLWGRAHLSWLDQNAEVRKLNLLTSGEMTDYLRRIQEQAWTLWENLIAQMSEQEGVTEALKAKDPMEWVRRRNSIQDRAREIVLQEVIYH